MVASKVKPHTSAREASNSNPRDRLHHARKLEVSDYTRQKEVNQINSSPFEVAQVGSEAYNAATRGGRTSKGRGHGGRGGRVPQDPKTFYCEMHGEDAGHRTKRCPQVVATKESLAK